MLWPAYISKSIVDKVPSDVITRLLNAEQPGS